MVSIAMYLSKMGIFFLVSEFLKDEYLIQVAEWEPNRHNINCSYHMIKYCGENFIWISWDVFEKMLFRGSKNVFFACLQIDDVPSFLVWKSRRENRKMVFGQSWSSDTTYIQACYIKMLEMKFSIKWYKSCFINHGNKKVSFIHNSLRNFFT
jgi:hypothetical protein